MADISLPAEGTMKITESIRAFLQGRKATHNYPQLLDLDPSRMEVQINVVRGRPVEGRRNTYCDEHDINRWWDIRVPHDADTEPHFEDRKMQFPLELYAAEIGSTGWNWRDRKSEWIGFDFDSVTHAKGLSSSRLDQIRSSLEAISYVELRRSTSGTGLHGVVYLDGIGTANHDEHAAVARAILGRLSLATGENLVTDVDVCGANLWLWSKRATKENQGFALLKSATTQLSASDLPANWRDHLDVVTRRRSKIRLPGENPETFEALASAHRLVPLEDAHREHIAEFCRMGFTAIWVPEHHLLQTHTCAFRRYAENHQIHGFFETISEGKDPGQPNCFAFPGDFGSWKLVRFNRGTSEAKTWEQDGLGWTTCWFNRRPNLKQAARALGGRDMKSGGFEFNTLAEAAKVAEALGKPIEVADQLKTRKAVVHKAKDGRLAIEVSKNADEGKPIGRWNSSDKKHTWTQVLDCPAEPKEGDEIDYDDKVRHLITPTNEEIGFVVKSDQGTWDHHSATVTKNALQTYGLSKTEAEIAMGFAVRKRWVSISAPFKPEFPGDRQWNLGAPQYVYPPAPRSSNREHPAWDAVFDHLGSSLTEAVRNNDWCKKYEIQTGPQWIRLWYAWILRDPFVKLPYLFFWGEGNAGKSTAYEAFAFLVTGGVVDAKRALTDRSGFNGELDGAVLCYIDEYDLTGNKEAELRVKEWSTATNISIRRMRCNLYHVQSTLHFIHLANDPSFCVALPGDVRKVIVHLRKPKVEIPRGELHRMLKEEGPAVMRTLLDLPLQPPDGRMAIAVLDTEEKRSLTRDQEPLVEFFAEKCEFGHDYKVSKEGLREAYHDWALPLGYSRLTPVAFGRKLMTVIGSRVKNTDKIETATGVWKECYTGIRLKETAAPAGDPPLPQVLVTPTFGGPSILNQEQPL